MKSNGEFLCIKCKRPAQHYCRGMCNPCYQRHLRQKHRDRRFQTSSQSHDKPKRNLFPFKAPRVGDEYQVDPPEKIQIQSERKYQIVYAKKDYEASNEFIKFCKLVIESYPNEGLISQGGAGFEENCIKLLNLYKDVSLAKYAVLFPLEMMADPQAVYRLNPEELQDKVDSACKEMIRIQTHSKEEFIDKIQMVVSHGVSETDLEPYIKSAFDMKLIVPQDVTEQLTQAREFSTKIKRRLGEKSITVDELRDIISQLSEYKVQTNIMEALRPLYNRATEWLQKVNQLNFPTFKQLNTLVSEGSSISLNLPELVPIKQKYRSIKKWIDTVHSLRKEQRNRKEKEKLKLQDVEKLVEEAEYIQFSHHEVENLKEDLYKVYEWKERVRMLGEDMRNDLDMNILLAEAEDLPLKIDNIQKMQKVLEWNQKVDNALKIDGKLQLRELQRLVTDAENKKINPPQLESIRNICEESKKWQANAKFALNNLVKISTLEEYVNLGQRLPGDTNELLIPLQKKYQRALEWHEKCKQVIQEKNAKLEVITALKNEHENLKVTCKEYKKILNGVNTKETWLGAARRLLLKFPKQEPDSNDYLDLLHLQKTKVHISTPSPELESINYLHQQSKSWSKDVKAVLNSNSLTIKSLPKIQELINRSNAFPVNIKQYNDLIKKFKSLQWQKQVINATKRNTSYKEFKYLKQEADNLGQKRTSIYHELDQTLNQTLNWVQRLKGFQKTQSIDELIAIYHDANNIPDYIAEKTALKHCIYQIFTLRDRIIDFKQQKGKFDELQQLIFEGDMLPIEIQELQELREQYNNARQWCEKSRSLLQYLPNPAFRVFQAPRTYKKRLLLPEYLLEAKDDVMEGLLHSVENAPEVEVICVSAVYNVTTHTGKHNLVIQKEAIMPPQKPSFSPDKRKRTLSLKQKEIDNKPIRGIKRYLRLGKTSLKYERETYCICQKEASVDDAMMVHCEFCEEWYHPTCIGLTQTDLEMHVNNEYRCSLCCERLGLKYDFQWPVRQVFELEDMQNLIEEGKMIDLETKEYNELLDLYQRIQQWRSDAQAAIEIGLRVDELMEGYSHKKKEILRARERHELNLHVLLIKYEGFPISLKERDQLCTIIGKREWLWEAMRVLHEAQSQRLIYKLLKELPNFQDYEDLNVVVIQLNQLKHDMKELHDAIGTLQQWGNKLQDIQAIVENPRFERIKTEKLLQLKTDYNFYMEHIKNIQEFFNQEHTLEQLQRIYGRSLSWPIVHESIDDLKALYQRHVQWKNKSEQVLEMGTNYEEFQELYNEGLELKLKHDLISQLLERMEAASQSQQISQK